MYLVVQDHRESGAMTAHQSDTKVFLVSAGEPRLCVSADDQVEVQVYGHDHYVPHRTKVE